MIRKGQQKEKRVRVNQFQQLQIWLIEKIDKDVKGVKAGSTKSTGKAVSVYT